jgi:hypothetical protein|nr:hypothetical protein [Neorhizobium tomejilense]
MTETETLGRFGHHPDPAIDFCVEVEIIDSEWVNTKLGFENGTPGKAELRQRVDKAMQFRVGGDLNAIMAKSLLRMIDAEMTPHVDGLDELERLAKAATPGPHHIYTHGRDDNNWKANSDFQMVATPEAVLALIARLRSATPTTQSQGDWTVSDTETAGFILDYLGIGQDASKEPTADRRRDRIAGMIRGRLDTAIISRENVRVGVLEWLDNGVDGWVAETSIGDYELHKVGFGDVEEWELRNAFELVGHFPIDDLDVAKDAAQKDYERRVRSAVLSDAADHGDGGDNSPRYTTKRLRDEIAKAKQSAMEEAAAWHVNHGASMLHVSKSQMAKDHGNAEVYVERYNWHTESAAAIRALAAAVQEAGK